MANAAPHAARWGLLVTTAALGVALVGTGLASYVGARRSSQAIMQARGFDLAHSVRQEIRLAGGVNEVRLADLLDGLEEQGVRYLALVDPRGELIESAGLTAAALPREPPRGHHPGIEWLASGRVRVVAPLYGPGRGRMRPGGGGMGPPGARHVLVMELEPTLATALSRRAGMTLLLSVGAAALLLALAGVFWRLSRRAERLGEQLVRDRELKNLGEMSAVLSHELRNPLASLKGHAQLLLEKLAPEQPGRAGAEQVLREALRLEALSNQILEFARSGTLERRSVDPLAVARAAADSAGVAGVRLLAREPPAAWSLDAARVEQVLVNLLRNAAQASPAQAEVELTIAMETGRLLFQVRDHGPGLEQADPERLFAPFHTGRIKGTGLGLAIARRIVEGHGGAIQAVNHPEGGALFTVVLPPGRAT